MGNAIRLGLDSTYANDLEGLYQAHLPAGFSAPSLLELNRPLIAELGLDLDVIEANAADLFSGTLVPVDAIPIAQAYAGHQFGHFSPQLGDGRAVLLGEVVAPNGRRHDIQLKGTGRTPFSRGGDGRAPLGPVLREYLLGEAMHHLGIPTTRALAAVATGETVMRSRPSPGAVLARVASSHLRIGTLEYFSARDETEKLSRLVDYSLARHYPDAVGNGRPAAQLLRGVAVAQAKLIAKWMNVGFIHGVMNTDNATLSGETIDFGPCAFLEAYSHATVHSSIDRQGRYAYGNQPQIGQWNLARMAEALLPMLADDDKQAVELAQGALDLFKESFNAAQLDGMRKKIGLVGVEVDDEGLLSDLLDWMQSEAKDFTLTFRSLARGLLTDVPPFDDTKFSDWSARWKARLGDEDRGPVATRMDAVNPIYIARNHVVEEALDAAHGGDLAPFRLLLKVLATPFTEQKGREKFAAAAPADFGPYQTFCGT